MIDYNAYCAKVGVKPRKVVDVVSADFPKFSKIQFSMCANPAYGVCMRPEAEALLVEAFGEAPGLGLPAGSQASGKKPEHRAKANAFRVRLDDATAAKVRELMAELHFANVQSFLEWVLLSMLDDRRANA